MKWFSLIWKNIFRNKRRTWLTMGAITLALFIFITLITILETLQVKTEVSQTEIRLAVIDKYGDPHIEQPLRYISEIQNIDGVQSVTPVSFTALMPEVGGAKIYIAWSVFAQEYAKTFRTEVSNIPKKQYENFTKTKNGAIIGLEASKQNNWKVGDNIILKSMMDNFDMKFNICGIYKNDNQSNRQLESQLLIHYDYYDEKKGKPGMVNFFWLKVKDRAAAFRVTNEIEKKFEYAQSEITVQTENTMAAKMSTFTATAQMVIKIISFVVLGTIFLVVGNAIALTMRDRKKEIAVLKTLGFSQKRVLGIVIGESIAISILAGMLGTLLSYILFSAANLSITLGFTFNFYVTYRTIAIGFIISTLLGLIGGLVPSFQASRVSIVKALRSL